MVSEPRVASPIDQLTAEELASLLRDELRDSPKHLVRVDMLIERLAQRAVNVDELDEHGAVGWTKHPALWRALDCVRLHDVVRLVMTELRVSPYGVAYDQDKRELHLDIPHGLHAAEPKHVEQRLREVLAALVVVAPGVTLKVGYL